MLARAIGISLAMLLAGEAQAGGVSADCVWNQVPPATRDRLVLAYALGGREAARKIAPAPNMADLAACGVDPATPEDAKSVGVYVGKLFAAVTLEQAAKRYLMDQGESERSLDDAWSAIGAERRALIRSAADDLGDDGLDPAQSDKIANTVLVAADAAARAAGQSSEAGVAAFGDYFLSRAMREAFEAQGRASRGAGALGSEQQRGDVGQQQDGKTDQQ